MSFLVEGSLFSCEESLANGFTEEALPKCEGGTCYCKKDDCNANDPQIKCHVGPVDTKKEQNCQHGIVNCKNTTTSKIYIIQHYIF